MKRRPVRYSLLLIILLATATLLWQTVQAGPPLICHPLKIGDRASLPWGDEPFEKVTKFDRRHLIEETIRILDAEDSALVHMETIRRAMLYAEEKETNALSLLACLAGRAVDARGEDRAAALALLDAGYAAQGLTQLGVGRDLGLGASEGIAGYRWVLEATELQPDDPELHFAAAMVTALADNDAHRHHVKQVQELSEPGSLVRKNLDARPHFGH
jgi:hypothetical protein